MVLTRGQINNKLVAEHEMIEVLKLHFKLKSISNILSPSKHQQIYSVADKGRYSSEE